jgi:hypothetical protein
MTRVTRKTRDTAPGEAGKNPFDQIREAVAQKRRKVPPEPVRNLALGAEEDPLLRRQGEGRRDPLGPE